MIRNIFSVIVIGLCIIALTFAINMNRVCLYKYEFMFPQNKEIINPKPSLTKIYTIRKYIYQCPLDTKELSSIKRSISLLKDMRDTKENNEILLSIKNRFEKESKTWSN